jgi:hypothetical protein
MEALSFLISLSGIIRELITIPDSAKPMNDTRPHLSLGAKGTVLPSAEAGLELVEVGKVFSIWAPRDELIIGDNRLVQCTSIVLGDFVSFRDQPKKHVIRKHTCPRAIYTGRCPTPLTTSGVIEISPRRVNHSKGDLVLNA